MLVFLVLTTILVFFSFNYFASAVSFNYYQTVLLVLLPLVISVSFS